MALANRTNRPKQLENIFTLHSILLPGHSLLAAPSVVKTAKRLIDCAGSKKSASWDVLRPPEGSDPVRMIKPARTHIRETNGLCRTLQESTPQAISDKQDMK